MQTAYTSYFGFSEKPFKFKPDPRFFYHNPNYDNAYGAVVKGLRERKKSWVVLTGESGTGKTTLLYKCKTALGTNFRIIPVPNTVPSINSFLSHIGKNLNLDISDDISNADFTQTIATIRACLASRAQQGQTAAVLIEDAQNLTDRILAEVMDLSKMLDAQKCRLQIIMLGSPELDKKLSHFNFPAEDSVYCYLAPLQSAEVNAFIQHQIQAANYQQNDLFSPEIIEDIVYYSKGIPRLINTLCDSALLIASRQNEKIITKAIIEEAARRCYLAVGVSTDKRQTPRSTISEHPLQKQCQATLEKPSSPTLQILAVRSSVSMNHRWRWASVVAITTLMLVGGVLLFYHYPSVPPSLAELPSKAATPVTQAATTTGTTTALGEATTSSLDSTRPAPSQMTNVALASAIVAPQYKPSTATAEEIPNTYIDLTQSTTAESINIRHDSTPQNNDLPHQPFTAFEKPPSTANFQPHSSSVFVEMRGSNKEVFDSAGRVKSVITRQ